MLQYWILYQNPKLSLYYFTNLVTSGLEKKQFLLQMMRLFISKRASYKSWARRRLNHVSWRIRVNYPVHTWTGNATYMQNLISLSVHGWLVLLTDHEVFHLLNVLVTIHS